MTAAKGKYGGRKVREGTVVSDKMQKTILVAVEEHVKHRLYKKRVRRVHKFMAHDEAETAKLGDRVRIIESRPASRNKRWAIVEVLRRVELPEVAAESIDLELLGEVKPAPSEAEELPTEEGASVEAAAAEPEAAAEAEAEPAAPEEVVVEEAAGEEEPAAAQPSVAAEATEQVEAVEPAIAAEAEAETEPAPTGEAVEEPVAATEEEIEPSVAEETEGEAVEEPAAEEEKK